MQQRIWTLDTMGGSDSVSTDMRGSGIRRALVGVVAAIVLFLAFSPSAAAVTGSATSNIGPLDTVSPVITNLTVTPDEVEPEDLVTITFSVSEAAPLVPSVLINGNVATFASSLGDTQFEYEYTVSNTDMTGEALIEIDLADAVGNLGSLDDSTSLTILNAASALPITLWPAAVALVFAAIGVLSLRRRRGLVAGALLLLAAPTALAQAPELTNVTFVQQPTLSGTEVIITYDLDSPNGTSDITVFLSKDAGFDGFPFPVTSVTGDLTDVATGTGYTITWDVAADYPNEEIPDAQLRVIADDGVGGETYSLNYFPDVGGSILGDLNQTVLEGNDGTPVEAVADAGYVFAGWDDGVTDNPRTDTNVMADIFAMPIFVRIPEMIDVAAGSFDMGNSGVGDDATYARPEELPLHTVNLARYEIGKFEVTNRQLADVFNWADEQGRFDLVDSTTAVAYGQELLDLDSTEAAIGYFGSFVSEIRFGIDGAGDPAAYNMADHPAVELTWYGAAVYCNWLSEIEGRTPVYDTATWEADFSNNGYHLPTEAQWERAAAWDGAKHWIYGFTSDTLTGRDRVTYNDGSSRVNPLGLTSFPETSPVGWFDGVNVSPNGNIATVDSASPIGAYDMSGNVSEWCHDWFDSAYYASSPQTDPNGPASGSDRVIRGGGWNNNVQGCRSARRIDFTPSGSFSNIGFRLARTVEYSLSYNAGAGGTLTGDTSQTVLPGEDGTPVTAVPDAGFLFGSWSDGVTDNPRTDTNVGAVLIVTARFAPELETISVAEDSFEMGNSGVGDDATFGGVNESPLHTVNLSPFEIGRFEVTNQQVAAVYNWALGEGYFDTTSATTAVAYGVELLDLDGAGSSMIFSGSFQAGTNEGVDAAGDPFTYSLDDHPVQVITWFGAAAFCNWLSELEGRTPIYDTATWEADFGNNGYHLPTEAQWEYAAAWDTTADKHYIYGFTADTLSTADRANVVLPGNVPVDPLGLVSLPTTSPVGWFNGVNVSPNGNVTTVDSPSPIGAYDMCGNAFEWCHDLHFGFYYSSSPLYDPRGATSGFQRSVRGGSMADTVQFARTAYRGQFNQQLSIRSLGFRVARSVAYTLDYSAGPGGSLAGVASQTVLPGADGTPVEAVPDVTYSFDSWSDGVTDNPRTDINVDSGLTVTANFVSDIEMISVAAGSFDMGNSGVGDDATYNFAEELPAHTVTLSAFEIAKFEMTNQQVADVYNWASDQGLIDTLNANTATAFGEELLDLDGSWQQIAWNGSEFVVGSREGFSMAEHPVVEISWFGAAAYCNWLSQIRGLAPVYDTSTWTANFANGGYHLPTEAQWERAAAWDGSKHWIYGFTSDTLTTNDRSNFNTGNPSFVNPLNLTVFPFTSPAGWFDGVNVSPNGNIPTVDSVSPIGAYDMTGNVGEWCHDWFDSGYYATSAAAGPDPTGPASGTERVYRDGGWADFDRFCRSAYRGDVSPATLNFQIGFRLARTVEYSLTYTAGAGGSLTGDTSQTVLPGGDGTAVTAVPNAGFVFVDWSDGVTDNPRTDVNVGSGVTVTANFEWPGDIPELIAVSAGSFDMGRTNAGDDASFGSADELPVHTVALSAYEIGRFEVTNQQVCDLFNWADDQGLFDTVNGNTATAFGEELLDLDSADSMIEYVGGLFQPETRTGDPGGSTVYSMAGHPAVEITWFGAVAYCNWLSQIAGRASVYDTGTWEADFTNDGYHLPREAQWERAAAWDGTKHWIYSFTADTLTGADRATYNGTNPIGITASPFTSPVGWFDGVSVNLNGGATTVDSQSPIGAYDMSGNVREWCHDWYDSAYYADSAATGPDPEGPASGTTRVFRGGSWNANALVCRSAVRGGFPPTGSNALVGFRLARTVEYSLSYSAGPGGSLTGNADQTVLPGGDGTPVEAVPDTGFVFDQWSDGVTDNPRTDTNVSSGVGVTALFTEVTPEMITVASGSFDMGRTNLGEDASGGSNELPVHTVELSAYDIGKFEVTNQQVCDVFNWANGQGYFDMVDATTVTVSGVELLHLDSARCHIEYVDGEFQPESRTGDPGGSTVYSMADNPVLEISWYGAAAFCNWLSEISGRSPIYDISTWEADFANDGFHLPTEAQWERAAAWDGSKHWIFGFTSDTISGRDRANYTYSGPTPVNPLGLSGLAPTAPVGWFDGVNVSPNGNIATVDSVSPMGAYDMSGNVKEWCHDYHQSDYYSMSPVSDPRGPATGANRSIRGGSHFSASDRVRTAYRSEFPATISTRDLGFRLARSISYDLTYTPAAIGGTLSGNVNQSVAPGEDGTAVTAVPNVGFKFTKWSDESTQNPRTDTNVDQGKMITAIFGLDI